MNTCSIDLLNDPNETERLGELVGELLQSGDTIALSGSLGAGKTTLLKTLIGDEPYDGGALHLARGTRLGLLRQEIDPHAPHTIREEARTALSDLDDLEDELRRLEVEMSQRGDSGTSQTSSTASTEGTEIITIRLRHDLKHNKFLVATDKCKKW